MNIVFISNYLTHHQLPFVLEMAQAKEVSFIFIATNRMEEERIRMGWGIDEKIYPFVRHFDDDMQECSRLVMESDVVICGGTHDSYIHDRVASGRLTFRYFERLYKTGQSKALRPRGYYHKLKEHTRYRKNPVYLLCAGAYVASDFHLFLAYPGKMLRWGYFPEFVKYSVEERTRIQDGKCHLLWTGRMLRWKHATDAILVAEALKKEQIMFDLTMIGDGECASMVRQMIEEKGLQREVILRPFEKPEEIRKAMLKSDIYLMTSDYEEGWGAVVNEAMNSGCAVIAGSGAGAVPYLIRHGKNGLVYQNGKTEELIALTLSLVKDINQIHFLGQAAYMTIATTWNASVACRRFLTFCRQIENPEKTVEMIEDEGPMSNAPLIAPGKGYQYCIRER